MMKSYWNTSLILSLVVHSTIFLTVPKLINNDSSLKGKSLKTIEVIPQEIKTEKPPELKNSNPSLPASDVNPPPYLDNLVQKVLIDSDSKMSLDKINTLEQNSKSIIFSELPKEKELKKNPAYMDYYHLIRERIRANAYRYYDLPEEGEVALTFIILDNGKLHSIYLDEDSNDSRSLIRIALRSIEDAAPFPSFPEQLKYPKLQFNISIYFKNN